MGTDIHAYAEVRQMDGTWLRAGKVFPHPYYKPDEPTSWSCYAEDDGEEIDPPHTSEAEHTRGCYEDNAPLTADPIYSRNYDLFAILANVRNGYGFAGVDTGDGFRPIAMPRGLPDDADPWIKAESDHWGVDGHSHTWLLLSECQKYDWHTQVTVHRGWVPAETDPRMAEHDPQHEWWDSLESMRAEGRTRPKSWAGGIDGRSVVKMTVEKYDRLKFAGISLASEVDEPMTVYVQLEWMTTYYDSVKQFVDTVLPRLAELGAPDDVRVTMWFDN